MQVARRDLELVGMEEEEAESRDYWSDLDWTGSYNGGDPIGRPSAIAYYRGVLGVPLDDYNNCKISYRSKVSEHLKNWKE